METKKSVFETLSAIDCNGHTEKKNGLTYLSWCWAWAEVKKNYPSASYEIYHDPVTHRPYTKDDNLGIICFTNVTIEGETLEMWLPVMDASNNAMKETPYTYLTSKWEGGKKIQVEKSVDAADMFDVNKTIMRCLVKNLAMFGLGLYIYAGEDLPFDVESQEVTAPAPETNAAPVSDYTPVSEELYWQYVKAYAEGRPTKSGKDCKQTWMEFTHADRQAILKFDNDVANLKASL